jgi:hypothetical protein
MGPRCTIILSAVIGHHADLDHGANETGRVAGVRHPNAEDLTWDVILGGA